MRAVRKTPAALAVACVLVLGIAGHAGAAPPDGPEGADAVAPATSAFDEFESDDSDSDSDSDFDDTDTDTDDSGRNTDAVRNTDADFDTGGAGATPASAPARGGAERGINLDRPVSESELRYVTDFLVFRASMKDFQHVRRQRLLSDQVSWRTTACDTAVRDGAGFREACERREFGYHNFARQNRFDGGMRERVDRRFKSELRSRCAGKDLVARPECERQADVYFAAVGGM